MDNVTHNQHYVWRAYLRPWCDCKNEKDGIYFIWWNNKSVCKNTDVFDILRDKDFYQLYPLNKLELFLLENMFAKSNQNAVMKVNEAIVSMAHHISLAGQIVHPNNKEFTNLQIQSGETIQTEIEKMGIEAIERLRECDISWLNDIDKKTDFLIFICTQYFRTKSMKDRQLATLKDQSELTIKYFKKEFNDDNDYSLDWNKIYNYGCICLAHKVSFNLLAKNIKFKLIKSKNVRFIVSDQPVYNAGDDKANEFILFYPISPNLALMGSIDYQNDEVVDIDDNEVLTLNNNTLKHAHKFFMGKEKVDVNYKYPY